MVFRFYLRFESTTRVRVVGDDENGFQITLGTYFFLFFLYYICYFSWHPTKFLLGLFYTTMTTDHHQCTSNNNNAIGREMRIKGPNDETLFRCLCPRLETHSSPWYVYLFWLFWLLIENHGIKHARTRGAQTCFVVWAQGELIFITINYLQLLTEYHDNESKPRQQQREKREKVQGEKEETRKQRRQGRNKGPKRRHQSFGPPGMFF